MRTALLIRVTVERVRHAGDENGREIARMTFENLTPGVGPYADYEMKVAVEQPDTRNTRMFTRTLREHPRTLFNVLGLLASGLTAIGVEGFTVGKRDLER